MALDPEDGTGRVTADCYANLAWHDAYHAARGREGAAWALVSSANREGAIREANQYLDNTFINRYPGKRLTPAQALEFPRTEAEYVDGTEIAEDEIPMCLKVAEAILALAASAAPLDPDLERGGRVIKERVGPISEEYSESAPGKTTRSKARKALRRILLPAGVIVRA